MINSTFISQLDQFTIHLLSHNWEPHGCYILSSDPSPTPPHFSNNDIMNTLKYISINWFSPPNVSHIAMLAKTRVCHTACRLLHYVHYLCIYMWNTFIMANRILLT